MENGGGGDLLGDDGLPQRGMDALQGACIQSNIARFGNRDPWESMQHGHLFSVTPHRSKTFEIAIYTIPYVEIASFCQEKRYVILGLGLSHT